MEYLDFQVEHFPDLWSTCPVQVEYFSREMDFRRRRMDYLIRTAPTLA